MVITEAENSYVLYGDHRSGNCYKAALILALTGRHHEWRAVDVLTGATRQADFLSMNPNGRVPLLQLPDGRYLAESNAILLHLAEGTAYLPEDRYLRALVYQWLFFEQYSHEPYIAVARFLLQFDHGQAVAHERLALLQRKGHDALGVMEQALEQQDWLGGSEFSIADIALYAYTHTASDGGFDLSAYPAILAWIERVKDQPGHFDLDGLSP